MTTTSEALHMAEATPGDLYAYLTALIKQAVSTYLAQERIDFDIEHLPIDLRFSAQASFGDYSMPVMQWGGKHKLARKPLSIAEALAAILREMQILAIQEITVTAPGFLNFRLNRPFMGQVIIERVLDAGADYGQGETGVGTKIVVEHTNINSNKAAHVGHLRNSCIGDTVVRMLRSQGYQVEAQNYIDDSGVQVADVVMGFTLLQKGALELSEGNEQLPGESFDYYCSRVYVAMGKAFDEAEKVKEDQPEKLQELKDLRKTVLHAIEHGGEPESGPDYPFLAAGLSHQIVKAHLQTMSRLNVSYDLLTWDCWRGRRPARRRDAGYCPLAKEMCKRKRATARVIRFLSGATAPRLIQPKTLPTSSGNSVCLTTRRRVSSSHLCPGGGSMMDACCGP
jgi:arginyl-tRNA synthetase